MLSKEHIASSLPYLHPSDTVEKALEWMNEHHIQHLPVVEEDHFRGLIAEDDLLNADPGEAVGSLSNHFSRVQVLAHTHLTEALQKAQEFGLTLVPVVEKDGLWVGSIGQPELIRYLVQMLGLQEPGGLLVLEMEKRDFSFSEISKLVETNDAQITQLNSYYDNNLSLFFVCIRVNKFEISDIVATFQRYEYRVKYYFGEELYENELKNNFDHLMNYLNI